MIWNDIIVLKADDANAAVFAHVYKNLKLF